MSTKMQQFLMGGAMMLVFIIILLVLVIQFDNDGAVLIANDSGTLAIVAAVILGLGYFVSDVLKSRNFAEGYGKLIDKLVGNVELADDLESRYMAMPDGLTRDIVDLMADAAKHLVGITPTDRDDKLATFIDQIRDGLPNE
jgi:hypothetical protein